MQTINNKYVAITGGLTKLSRYEARHKVERAGGIYKTNGSKKIDILIVSDEIKRDTVKLLKIRNDCYRMSENEFYNIIRLRW